MIKNPLKYFPIFVLPALVMFSIAFLIPFIMGLGLSFFDFTIVTDARFNGLDNYIRAFQDPSSNFLYSLGFTTLFTVVSVVSVNILAFIFALLLTKGLKGTNFFKAVFFTPNLIGGIVLGYVWQTIINGVLAHFNMTILMNPSYGFWGLVLITNWQLIGYTMVIYIAGIQNISVDVLEAAKIDGAGNGRITLNIIIPLVMQSVTICSFLTLTNSFKMFDQNLALTSGGPANQTEMLALNIYRTFYGRNGWSGAGQAKAVVFFVIVGIIALIQLRITRNKEASS